MSSTKHKWYTNFADELIEAVSQRPILWDKTHENHNHRQKVSREWDKLEVVFKRPAMDIKSKWRNVKDTFHREAKKMSVPSLESRDLPLIKYYQGQWKHFESLLFLWDEERHGKGDEGDGHITLEINGTEVERQLKYEITDSDDTDVGNDPDTENMDIQTIYSAEVTDPIAPDTESRRSYRNYTSETSAKKRRYESDAEIDEDLHFAKSLVPFMKQLNPIRKLVIRNEIHNLLLKELLCSRCKTKGPQPDCHQCS